MEDVTIKVSDEGGGIPRSGMPNIWTYLYSTANHPVELAHQEIQVVAELCRRHVRCVCARKCVHVCARVHACRQCWAWVMCVHACRRCWAWVMCVARGLLCEREPSAARSIVVYSAQARERCLQASGRLGTWVIGAHVAAWL